MRKSIKRLSLFIAAGILSAQAHAASVSVATAKSVGANFLVKKGVAGVSSASDLTLAYTASSVIGGSTVNDYYVFNVTGKKSFVMVSADDIIIPILAYSNRSAFDTSHMSPSTKDWIDGYRNQIAAAIKYSVPAKATTAGLWSDLRSASASSRRAYSPLTSGSGVSPLISTTWDQDGYGDTYSAYPYNYYCPNTSVSGGLSVTGCVSTAMAQLMKYWNWPTVGCGSHTYYDAYSSSEGTGSDSWNTVDYDNTVYDWSGMPLTSSNEAVATLMYSTGVSVNMSYSATESSSYVTMTETAGINCAEYALKTYFHYSPSLQSKLRYGMDGSSLGSYYEGGDYEYYTGLITVDSTVESSWVTMLQNELSAGRPMLYIGTGSLGGHCWICDGWETSDDMFDFNWGWSGASDGYYTVDNLAPPALGTGGGGGNFNYDQAVVMGVKPDSFPAYTGSMALAGQLVSNTSTPMQYGTAFSISTTVQNTGASAFNGSFCIQVFDTASNLVTNLDTLSSVSIPAGSSDPLTFSCSSWAVIPWIYNGLRVAYQPSGSTAWTPVANSGSYINYTVVGVLNDTDIALYDSLHVGSPYIAPGSAFSVTTTIGNQGTADFNGNLEAVLVNTYDGSQFLIQEQTGASIPSYYDNTYSFFTSAVPSAPGIYALEILHQYDGSGSFYTSSSDYYMNPVLIHIGCTDSAGTITSTAASVCVGSTITLSDTTSGGSWSSANTGIATISTGGVVTGLAAGTDTLIYSVSGACGTYTASAAVTVVGAPSVGALSGLSSVCIGGHATYTDTTLGGTWAVANTNAAVVAGVVTGNTSGTDTLSYTVTGSCGTATATKVISIVGTPSVGAISGLDSLCTGGHATYTDGTSGGTWSASNTHASIVGGVVTGNTAGFDTLSYTISASCGTSVATKVIRVISSGSVAAVSGADSMCIGSVDIYTDATSGGAWSVSNAHASVVAGTVTATSAGTDTLSYSIVGSCGTISAKKVIKVLGAPVVAAISGADFICTGAGSVYTDATAGGAWSLSNAFASAVSGSVTGTAAGTDTLSYTVSSICGTASAQKVISIVTSPSVAAISGADSVCTGAHELYTDATTGGTWSSSNTHATVVAGLAIGITAGTDTLSYAITSTCGDASAVKVITVEGRPSVAAIAGIDTVCLHGSESFTDTTAGGIWGVFNANVSVSAGTITGNTLGKDTVVYTVLNSCGSTSADYVVEVVNCSEGVNNINTANDIKLYPNPAQNNINIVSSGETIATVVITDMLGREIINASYHDKQVTIGVGQLASGVYMVRINGTQVYKVTKE